MVDIVKGGSGKDLFMTEEQFALLTEFVGREFGIIIKGDKRLTLHTKLSHRLGILGIQSYGDYYNYVLSDPEERYNFISHITNNETYFLREKNQLTAFSDLLATIKKSKQKKNSNRIDILSAGCSTGEEAYTLNILLMESGLFAWGWQTGIIGMDVSKTAIKKALKAEYTKNSFRMLNGNADFVRKYFDSYDEKFVLKKPYRHNVSFVHRNILAPASFEGLSGLDVIFSRNMLIYMSDPAIERIARNFHGALSDDGYLILGSSESLLGKTDLFVPEHRDGAIIYRKNAL